MSTSKFRHAFEYHTDEYTLDITATWLEIYDKKYGADADGNRGEPMYFIEDLEIIAKLFGVDVTDTLKDRVFKEIEEIAMDLAKNGDGVNLTKDYEDAAREFWADARRDDEREEKEKS